MANTLTIASSATGRAIIMQGGLVWNGTDLVPFVDADFDDYLLTPVRIGTASALWLYTVPAGLPSGDYDLVAFAGATPAVTDLPDNGGTFSWDGTNAWLPRTSLAAKDVTLTLKDAYGAPSVGAEVWVTRSADINDVVAGTFLTDEDGEVVLQLVPGNYFRWAEKDGESFTNPQAFSVTA